MARKGKKIELRRLPVIEPDAAGVDIGATQIFVAVPPDRDPAPVRCPPKTCSSSSAPIPPSLGGIHLAFCPIFRGHLTTLLIRIRLVVLPHLEQFQPLHPRFSLAPLTMDVMPSKKSPRSV